MASGLPEWFAISPGAGMADQERNQEPAAEHDKPQPKNANSDIIPGRHGKHGGSPESEGGPQDESREAEPPRKANPPSGR
jgi:hypothetical protein